MQKTLHNAIARRFFIEDGLSVFGIKTIVVSLSPISPFDASLENVLPYERPKSLEEGWVEAIKTRSLVWAHLICCINEILLREGLRQARLLGLWEFYLADSFLT